MGKSWRPEPDGGFDEGIELEPRGDTLVKLSQRSSRDRRILDLQRIVTSAVPLMIPRDYWDATDDVLLRCPLGKLFVYIKQAAQAGDWQKVVTFCERALLHPDLKNRPKTYLILSIAYKNLGQVNKARNACENGLRYEQMPDSNQARDLRDMRDNLARLAS